MLEAIVICTKLLGSSEGGKERKKREEEGRRGEKKGKGNELDIVNLLLEEGEGKEEKRNLDQEKWIQFHFWTKSI